MSEPKFTHAPWKVREFYNEGLFGSTSTTYDIEIGNDTLRFLSFRNLETTKANAYLIAAAPEMYDMLQSLLAGARELLCDDTVDKMEHILKKARGEQNENR